MATSMRGSVGNGKERRGTSAPSLTIKKTPKPSLSTSPNDEKSNSPTHSRKPVPSYLRSTRTSSLDPNKQPKKPSTDASVSKPTNPRRRSFDRPPSSSLVQKAIRGGLTAGARDIKPQRSLSSNKLATSSSARPSSEKLYARTSSLKVGIGKVEPNLSKSRTLKQSNLASSTYKKKAPKSVTSESSVECENRLSVDHLTLEDDLVNLDEHEVQSLPEISEMPDSNEELADPTNVTEEENLQEKSMVVDQVSEETEEVDSQLLVEETADEKATEEKVDEEELTNTTMEEEKVSDAEKAEVEPTEVKDESRTVSSSTADSAAPKTIQSALAGKKDKQDYNNVIEQTASKLMGGRKNKVLALAGAFETVISLERH